jgi:hypothetical protein
MSKPNYDLVRFLVEYETNGQGTFKTDEFPSLNKATSFAHKGIKNGTIWPMEARIIKEIRTSIHREWEADPEFKVFEITD